MAVSVVSFMNGVDAAKSVRRWKASPAQDITFRKDSVTKIWGAPFRKNFLKEENWTKPEYACVSQKYS